MSVKNEHFDLVLIGSGFASSFYLYGALKSGRPPGRVLVIEKGRFDPHFDRVRARRFLHHIDDGRVLNRNPEKPWTYTTAFGGGSNCWYGSTPRLLPGDFKMQTRYGVGEDWPIDYNDLEPFYSEVEQVMEISGSDDMPYTMSKPYPLPPHTFSVPDKALKAAYPDRFFHLPTARATEGGKRARCCGNSVCYLCPIDSKFTIENGFVETYKDTRIVTLYETEALGFEHEGSTVSAALCRNAAGAESRYTADRFVLGANAIFNPYLLLKSGIDLPQTGRGLCEQVGVKTVLTLDGMENLPGSTITTGWGVNDLFGEHRSRRAGYMYNTVNRPLNLSLTPGAPFSELEVIVAIEDFRQPDNRVRYDPSGDKPIIEYSTHSPYAQNTLDVLQAEMERVLSVLPLKSLVIEGLRPTESHIQCTTIMGTNSENSVLDRHCIHHTKRNLIVLGAGNFPTASPPNPSLTVSALSLYSAFHTS